MGFQSMKKPRRGAAIRSSNAPGIQEERWSRKNRIELNEIKGTTVRVPLSHPTAFIEDD